MNLSDREGVGEQIHTQRMAFGKLSKIVQGATREYSVLIKLSKLSAFDYAERHMQGT